MTQRYSPTVILLLAVIAVAIPVALLNQPEFTGDPGIYRDRMAEMFAGAVPYVGFYSEHLPLSILPMAFAWLLGGLAGDVLFTIVFAALMAICLVLTAMYIDHIGAAERQDSAGVAWVVMAAPLIPIVLFRTDPFPVVLATAALAGMVVGAERKIAIGEFAGTLAKGWPGLYSIVEWERGQRPRAVILGATTVLLMLGLLLLPGFSQGRVFTGLHSESVVGGAIVAFRSIIGAPLDLLYQAGATYVSVPTWAWILNLDIGMAVGLVAIARFRPSFSLDHAVRTMAAAVVVLLVASPLLSPQFLLWPTPFLALHPSGRVRRLSLVVMSLTLVYMLGWNPDFLGNQWWVYLLSIRNVGLVALAGLCAWTLGDTKLDQEPKAGAHSAPEAEGVG